MGVELSGHAQKIETQRVCIACRSWEVIIAPAAGRQTFQLQVAIVVVAFPFTFEDVTRVVEDTQVRADFMHCGRELFEELQKHFAIVRLPIL